MGRDPILDACPTAPHKGTQILDTEKARKPRFHAVFRAKIGIGVTGFEPTTPSSLTKCASQLRYTPIFN